MRLRTGVCIHTAQQSVLSGSCEMCWGANNVPERLHGFERLRPLPAHHLVQEHAKAGKRTAVSTVQYDMQNTTAQLCSLLYMAYQMYTIAWDRAVVHAIASLPQNAPEQKGLSRYGEAPLQCVPEQSRLECAWAARPHRYLKMSIALGCARPSSLTRTSSGAM